jgi:hypothetical protein
MVMSMPEEPEPQPIRFRYKLSNWEIEVEGDEELIKEVVSEIKKKELPPYGSMESEKVVPGLYS